jgi:hypothetical protein
MLIFRPVSPEVSRKSGIQNYLRGPRLRDISLGSMTQIASISEAKVNRRLSHGFPGCQTRHSLSKQQKSDLFH